MDDDAPKTEELVLQQNPRVTLQLPNRLLSRAEWTQLILDASSRVVESLNADTTRAEYKRGMRRLAEILLPHPQLHPTIKTILLGMCPEIRVTVPLNLPVTFDELDEFIGQLENQKLWILGMLAGEKVLLTMSGHVPMQELVEEFTGPVEVDFGDEKSDGIVLGHVRNTGTALIALSDMRLIMYNVPDALYPYWNGLRRQKSAFYWIEGNDIILSYVELKAVNVLEEMA